jgi:hypothetical protein
VIHRRKGARRWRWSSAKARTARRSSSFGALIIRAIAHRPLQHRDQRLELNTVFRAANHLFMFPLESV